MMRRFLKHRSDWHTEWRRFREVEWRSLDPAEAGSWPKPLQLLCCALVMAAGIAAAQWLLVTPGQQALADAQDEEQRLLDEYGTRAWQAANLPLLQAQMGTLDRRMEQLIAMLPTDTEVPSLLDGISELARRAQLEIELLKLEPTVSHDFYIEQPLAIRVRGDYHHLGAFMAGMAALPRIVTLHDFTLQPVADSEGGGALKLSLQARTYRYVARDDNRDGTP
ncbi:type IV pilus assembly protein PilO [Kushneria sinocarnis]|uniref:Type IV pilus assembly protein PilO n=1 Tax=Kushneria sinocarnis TaxID=595502 RepID=A0A420WXF1_9GAMM|nr:type 4a pilus biogenesis protein PilO [Kushneria sinocarnis]RKR04400.1 type IV pilus assembly protein PilO [Kushneria sinocarnis]